MNINKHLVIEKRSKKYSKVEIRSIVEEASMAFWGTVSDYIPEVDTSNLDTTVAQKLETTMQMAVKSCIEPNT